MRRGSPFYRPRPVAVAASRHGVPLRVAGRAVVAVRESWLVEDGWWSERPLARRYWEVVVEGGRDVVVFKDLRSGRWFWQR